MNLDSALSNKLLVVKLMLTSSPHRLNSRSPQWCERSILNQLTLQEIQN